MTTESAFIESLKALATHPAARGLVDDAAVLELSGETLVLTHDVIAEGVHYWPDTDPADVAWKLVAVNLSDLAAKGTEPLGVLYGHVLDGEAWDARFVAGLRAVLTEYDVPLLGGDTVRLTEGAPRWFGLTAIGRASCDRVPARSGAWAGDALYMTGTIGDAMAGCELTRKGRKGALADAYLRPRPRLAEGQALAARVHAMMDISDGLLLDAARMADASGLSIDIARDAVPFSPEFLKDFADRRDEAMRWGDDYELLFAAPEDFAAPCPATRIGRFAARGDHALLLDGVPLAAPEKLGYSH